MKRGSCYVGRSRIALQSVIMATAAVAGCDRQEAARPDTVRPVKTMVVAAEEAQLTRTFPGRVEASKKAQLAFLVPGVLAKLPVKEGQVVAKGDLIAQLRTDEYEARLKTVQAQLEQSLAVLLALRAGERPEETARRESLVRASEATVANAKAEFESNTELLKSDAIARLEYERSDTAYRVAQEELKAAQQLLGKASSARAEDIAAQEAAVRVLESRVQEARIQVEDCSIIAPFDGVIARRMVDENQHIMVAQPIVEFQDAKEIDIVVDVPETVMRGDIRSADVVKLVAEIVGVPNAQFPAQIKEVAQLADPATQTFHVRVGIKAPAGVVVLPGMTATVTMGVRNGTGGKETYFVPITAIFKEDSGDQVAWVLRADQSVGRHPVRVGTTSGGMIEVIDGLHAGDRIAVAGTSQLREGMKVHDLGASLGGARR